MPKLQIDNQAIEVPAGTSLLTVAQQLGVAIPTLCYVAECEHVTSCMVCMVKDRSSASMIAACSTLAEDGMDIVTDTADVLDARRTALELLLSDHIGDCVAPCQRGCPAHMNIPLMIRQIAAAEWRQAAATVLEDIALPAVLGRICPAPCEKVCRRRSRDEALSICLLKGRVGEYNLEASSPCRPVVKPDSGRRAAIVGAGPAGLSAAFHLRRRGHACTIYERAEKAGGGLHDAMAAHAAASDVLTAEIDFVLSMGAELKTGCEIGVDVEMAALREQYDVVILTTGEITAREQQRFDINFTERGFAVDSHTCRSSDPQVFAGGAAVNSGRLAVRAVQQGKVIAAAVDQQLSGAELSGIPRLFESRIGKLEDNEIAEYMQFASERTRLVPETAEIGFTTAEAAAEAGRCMHCDCRKPVACKLRQYTHELNASQRRYAAAERRPVRLRTHGRVIYEPGKCIACGICVRLTQKAKEPLGLTLIGRGFNVEVGVPFNETLEQGLQKVAIECVNACPTGALSFIDRQL